MIQWQSYLYLVGMALLLSRPTLAHNGAMAIAVPVKGIKVDGDLSDWPAGMRRYPIARPEFGDKPKGPADFQGEFRIGYNSQENALYVAVEVQDESVVKEAAGGVNFYPQEGRRQDVLLCIAGGCSILQAAKLYAGVRLGDWLSKVKKRLPFTRSMLFYRLPGQQDAQEAELRAKYTLIATEMDDRLSEESSFEVVDALVESKLK